MAEQEVAKHTKKAYTIWGNNEHGFWHKFFEFLTEIFIIVFAVSVSIWFHNLSESRHDKKEAKEYLTGLRTDLLKDIEEMKEDSLSFALQIKFFRYLIDSGKTHLDSVYIDNNFWMFDNRTALVPNVSRFEALKFSGKMNLIEDKELLDEILNLYEEKIPALVTNANLANNYKERTMSAYMDKNMLFARSNRAALLNQIKNNDTLVYNFKRTVSLMPYIIKNYHEVISQNSKLIHMIDEEIK